MQAAFLLVDQDQVRAQFLCQRDAGSLTSIEMVCQKLIYLHRIMNKEPRRRSFD